VKLWEVRSGTSVEDAVKQMILESQNNLARIWKASADIDYFDEPSFLATS
jgi:hypothetical protein